MSLYHIATSRPVGHLCRQWAARETDRWPNWEHTVSIDAADVVISVMYDKLLTEEFINKPGRRCYNFHPGILPQYRGSGAFSWAILNQEERTGITLHQIDVNMDTGPIIDVWTLAIGPSDTAGSLFERAMTEMYRMFVTWFSRLLVGDVLLVEQDESEACVYYRKHLNAALDISHVIRAFTFEGKPSAYYYNRNGDKVEVKW